MSFIRFGREICGDFRDALQREWLETNGLGGFASSTISGANTRRYHGLLVAAVEPIVRCVLLSKLEETLVVGEQRFELSVNLYPPGIVHPRGWQFLSEFRLDPFPVFTFEAGGVTVEKRVFMVDGENTVVVEYAMVEYAGVAGRSCRLELRPLIAFRGYHELTHANVALNKAVDQTAEGFSIQPYAALPRVFFAHNAEMMAAEGEWYLNFEYPVERARGLDCHEDLYCPCRLEFDLAAEAPAVVIASTLAHTLSDAEALKAAEVQRRTQFSTALLAAASQFLVKRGDLRTIIAGYPWFTDWGRDTMIALPGLTLANGRLDVARDILLEFAQHVDQGMLPNAFPDANEPPSYNSLDASLWFFEAIRQYLEASKDVEFVRNKLYGKLTEIVDWHVRGTRYGIHMDDDGLIAAGDANTQLTWMDARVNDKPVTPRNGKPVEIQALWYNALRFVQRLAQDFGDEACRSRHEALAMRAGKNFNLAFWNEEAGCLFDVINGDGRDASLRPNQLIALSPGYCAIPETRARRIIAAVERSLLTPFGLRTLAPDAPGYRGRCEGPPSERDAAYHQGTVWPWLLGPFIAADIRFNGEAARKRAPELLAPLRQFMESRGTGQLPEIFDGDTPHAPRGCFAQAWSVAELLRMPALISP
jgi:predicted glycogen debranching enzyme